MWLFDPVPSTASPADVAFCLKAILGSRQEGITSVDIVTLTALAGNSLVQAMVTDGWEGVRHRIARLFGRGQPDPKIEQRLDATRAHLVDATPSEVEQVRSAQAAQWQTRFSDLLDDHPDAVEELRALVDEIRTALPVAAADHSVAAGRDVKVSADQGSVAAAVIQGNVTLPGPSVPDQAGG
jgi:hypothetical protein